MAKRESLFAMALQYCIYAAILMQQLAGFFFGNAKFFCKNADAAMNEFVVGRLQIHHVIAFHST